MTPLQGQDRFRHYLSRDFLPMNINSIRKTNPLPFFVTFMLIILAMISCSGCERDSSEKIVDGSSILPKPQASSGVNVAVTAEQLVGGEDKAAAELWGECSSKTASAVGTTSISESCPEDVKKAGGCLKYAEELLAKKYPELLCRRGKKLLLKLSNGEILKFQNNTDDSNVENFILYFFNKYLAEIHYGLLYNAYYEGGSYELVNLATGKRTEVGGEVILSPDGNRLAVFNADLVAGFSSNVLSVYLVTPSDLVEEFVSQPEEWGPEDLRWIDNQTIEFNKVSFTGNGFEKERHKLQFLGGDISKSGKWGIDEGLHVEKEKMQIKLSDINELVLPNTAIVAVKATPTGAQVTGYGLSDIDALVLSASLASRYKNIRVKASNPIQETYCGRTFSKILIDIEGDSSTLESRQNMGHSAVTIKTKDGQTVECQLP